MLETLMTITLITVSIIWLILLMFGLMWWYAEKIERDEKRKGFKEY